MPKFAPIKMRDGSLPSSPYVTPKPSINLKRLMQELMQRNGVTVYDLAQQLKGKVSQSAIYKWFDVDHPEATINSRAVDWMLEA